MVQGNKRHGNRIFKTWYRVIRDTVTGYSRHGNRVIRDSSEIWLINKKAYIIGTRSHGVDGGKRNITEVSTAQRATEV